MNLPSDTTIKFNVSIPIDDIIDSLVYNNDISFDELIEVIKQIDLSVADWGFTENLYEYFKQCHEDYLKEEKERNIKLKW